MGEIERFINLPAENTTRQVRVLGIDLGTTNSTVSEVVWEPGKTPVCKELEIEQPTQMGEYTSPLVPSILVILKDNEIWVGEGAKRLRAFTQKNNLLFEKNLFYETKNDMGLQKSYLHAPDQLNHAYKIAGQILSFLKSGAEKASKNNYDHVSVSVPASFQLNQRKDTLQSCQYAGLDLQDDDLLDEPTAALIDYIITSGNVNLIRPGETIQCVVFDFGGGTCDISVVEIIGDQYNSKIMMSELSVSRYHRLGGGDIDSAIVFEILIPKLLEENNLKPLDLRWAEKKRCLEPQLLGTAESLKLSLSKEIDRLIKFNRYDQTDKSTLIAKLPTITCSLGKRQFKLSNPSLSAEQFEILLAPFLDRDSLYVRETEYRMTQSIFSPLMDALNRADKAPHEVDFCLMVGGSSLIPQVKKAVEDFFEEGSVYYFSDALDMQTSVSRGAAWNALFKHVTGKNLIRPMLHDGIDLLMTEKNHLQLIPSHTQLPYPADGSFEKVKLLVPSGNLFVDKLRLEVIGKADGQTIFNEVWTLPESAFSGAEITMEYQLTAGKQFHCRAYLSDKPEDIFDLVTENPLVNILNPQSVRLKIEMAEEELRNKGGGNAEDRDVFVQIARWYAELNQREKALDFLRMALQKIQHPDNEILNLMGIYYGELGDHEKSEKKYREANEATSTWGGPLFNLTLSFRRRGEHENALKTINQALEKVGHAGPYLTLKGMCLESLKRENQKQEVLSDAILAYDPPETLDDWELGWYTTTAELLEEDKYVQRAKKEKQKRRKKDGSVLVDDIQRPSISGDLIKKDMI
ncbi:MAG: Hsp70 family protein [Desulfamplus sp.]|nr:Hsp70 family protein [Desulfamplus sp.]